MKLILDLVRDKFQRHVMPAKEENGLVFSCAVFEWTVSQVAAERLDRLLLFSHDTTLLMDGDIVKGAFPSDRHQLLQPL